MNQESFDFLKDIIETPSPGGYEQPVQNVVRQQTEQFADEVYSDVHGNLISVLNPDGAPKVMLAGHCDQVGMMVNHISDEGYLSFRSVGGLDATVVMGQRAVVHTDNGQIEGVIGRKPIHLLESEERKKAPKIEDMFVDIGAEDKDAAQELVAVGDLITFRLELQKLQGDLVSGPGFDDKIGVFVVTGALRQLADVEISCAVYCVSTVQEELGLRGARTSAFGIDPDVGIAVDVTHATDYAGVEPKKYGDIKVGKGPTIARGPNINPALHKLLVETAKSEDILYQIEPAPRATGTDANAIQITRSGVAAALVSVPNRYMHSPIEVVATGDAEKAATLLAKAVARITDADYFIPRL